jgi:uncharacterized protein (DUF433 family)
MAVHKTRSTTRKQEVAVHPRIVVDPNIQGGRPVIRGTRVPIYVLVDAVAAGDSIRETAQAYEVSEADVRAALKHAASLVEEERLVALPGR